MATHYLTTHYSPLGGLALGIVLGGDVGGLGEQRGIARAEHLSGKAHSGVRLRLAPGAMRRIGAAQAVEQRVRAGLKIVLQLGMDAQRDLVDGELAGVVA